MANSLLLRMKEAVEFPLSASSNYKAKMRRLMRRIALQLNKVEDAESLLDKDDPTREFLALMTTYAKVVNVSVDSVINQLSDVGDMPKMIGNKELMSLVLKED